MELEIFLSHDPTCHTAIYIASKGVNDRITRVWIRAFSVIYRTAR